MNEWLDKELEAGFKVQDVYVCTFIESYNS